MASSLALKRGAINVLWGMTPQPFWGNSPQSIKIFRIKKNVIRIMLGKRRDSCRSLFREPEILPLASQYIFSYALCGKKQK
jgi:hypothetical protein